ncbi:uncharacterized protein [Prorops nasuta]|uniref:uncharacterized protein n=1 Tax=Prorops nasuta TaxID=863751 RepID=UPI0034CDD692
MTAIISVQTINKDWIQARTLLDTCSTAHFITERFAKGLNLPTKVCTIPISVINSIQAIARASVQLTIRSRVSEFQKTLTCLVVKNISSLIPSSPFPRNTVSIPQTIRLADPQFDLPQEIDMLIGSGTTLSMLLAGKKKVKTEHFEVVLQNTQAGWVVATEATMTTRTKHSTHNISVLTNHIVKFWEIEDLDKTDSMNEEDKLCQAHYEQNVFRENSGRYVVRLPFRSNVQLQFPESRSLALRRLHAIENKLKGSPTLKAEYNRVMDDYIALGHMTEVKNKYNVGYFMPHHAVVKPSSFTTKVRVVFDASAKITSGQALNDTLLIGPTIQKSIFEHLIKFRQYKYVLTGDIEKMYRQVLIHPEDRKYQQILWRVNGEIKTFEINTVTFGVASAPFLAIRTLHKLAEDEELNFPIGAHNIKNNMYVDDLITGAQSISDLQRIRDETTNILSRGGFHIRQWASNNSQIINDVNVQSIHTNFLLDQEPNIKILGIFWNNGPIILYAKAIMQETWKCKASWSDEVPSELKNKWSEFIQQLETIESLQIKRYIAINNPVKTQIHGFCDASQVGYGACIYIRTINNNSKVEYQLLCSKSRVAPLKGLTIPKAELCGALLLTRLYQDVIKSLSQQTLESFFWTDSSIVLHWINMPTNRLKIFVSNRVKEIQSKTTIANWHHVTSKDNPADVLSRGQKPREFSRNSGWFTGPPFLQEQEFFRPTNVFTSRIDLPELRESVHSIATIPYPDFFQKFSSFEKIIRIVAYCLRFCLKRKYVGRLTIEEINKAETRVLKLIQQSSFAEEITRINRSKDYSKGPLVALCPFIDDSGLIRVGGRLKKSKLSFSVRHPILLPSRHPITDIIIRDIHNQNHHSGIQTTLSILRQRFWITDGKNQIRKIVRNCVKCTRFRAECFNYKMADLPKVRLTDARPFNHVGIDYCGPFYLKERKFRNRTKIKTYVCVFICMVTRAVHLEVVSDMTTTAFLASLKRFASRRGFPQRIYSDNGQNFVGAKNELHDLYQLLKNESFQSSIQQYTITKRIQWQFTTPLSPHFGGLWEAAVKVFKHHLKRVVGLQLYTYEDFTTLTTEIEAIMNSRPICSLSSDPNDPIALTPAHFLIGEPLTVLPERDVTSIPQNRLSSWKLIVQAKQHFWQRWYLEYLHELQQRQKWTQNQENVKVGTIVLLKDKGLPCMQWSLGRVIELIPSDDGIVRSVKVKTSSTTLKRCVKMLCPLLPE